jgi:HAD superfamily hydrolase (TIGR01549 family)
MKYKAILYDLGDIFFEAHLWREWNYHELTALGYFTGSFAEFYDLYDSFLERIYTNDSRETYEQTFGRFLQQCGFHDDGTFTARSFREKKRLEDTRTLYDGVVETLAYVRAHDIKNVIVTDNESGEADIRRGILSKFSIDQFIDLCVTSRDVGATKPDPKIYFHALDRLGMTCSEVIFVGHDKDELDGAASIGIATAAYNNYLGRTLRTDFTIAAISELQNII